MVYQSVLIIFIQFKRLLNIENMNLFFILLFSLLRCELQPPGIGKSTGEYTSADSLKHKVYFGHSLERCESTPGEFSDYDAYSLADKTDQ